VNYSITNPDSRAPWPLQYARSTDVPWGKLFPEKWTASRFPIGWLARLVSAYLLKHPILQGFLLETRSLVYRMGIRYKRPHDVDGVVFGPYWEKTSDGNLPLSIRTQSCIGDTERFVNGFPWVTTIDAAVFVHAWELGAEWGMSNSCKSTESPQESCATSSASREASDKN
jgi:hypothetical protein